MGVNFRYPTLAPRRNPMPERMGTTTILSNARAVIPNPPTKYAEPSLVYDLPATDAIYRRFVGIVAPPFAGFIGDFIGIPATVMIVSALTLATIPLAFLLKDPRLGEQRV